MAPACTAAAELGDKIMTQPLYGANASQIKRNRRIAEMLMSNSFDASPTNPYGAIARIAQGFVGGMKDKEADKLSEQRNQYIAQALTGEKTPEELMSLSAQYESPELAQAAQFSYGKSRDAASDAWKQKEFDYRQGRDTKGDQQWQSGYGLQQDQFNWQKNKPVEVGGNLLDPNTYEPVYQSPPEPIKVGNSLLDPKTYQPIYEGGPNSVINNNMKGENEYDKARGKYFAESANTLDTEERGAINSINSLSALEQQMTDPNFSSGFMSGNVLTLQKAAVALGIADPSSVTSKEAFNSLSSKAALDSMGGSLGAGFSNADRDFVTNQVANLGNTPQGNQAIIGIHKKIAERKIEIARMARAYETKNGRLDNGFMNEMSQWAESNPLFPQSGGGQGQGSGYKIIGVE